MSRLIPATHLTFPYQLPKPQRSYRSETKTKNSLPAEEGDEAEADEGDTEEGEEDGEGGLAQYVEVAVGRALDALATHRAAKGGEEKVREEEAREAREPGGGAEEPGTLLAIYLLYSYKRTNTDS
jgi:hypothetical protein